MAEQKQYPQATPDGEAIPFEIVRPLGLLHINFTNVASEDAAIPAEAGFLVLRAKEADCWVMLDGPAVVPADGVHEDGLIFVGKDEIIVIDHNEAATISAMRVGTDDGYLVVQTCLAYADIRKRAQQERM